MDTFKSTFLIENILGIFKNYTWLGKYQNLAFFRILFELTVGISCLVLQSNCYKGLVVERLYYWISYINSLLAICMSVYYSKILEKIIMLHENFESYFMNDDFYQRKLKSRKKCVILMILIYNSNCLCTYFVYYMITPIEHDLKDECATSIYYWIEANLYASDFRFIIEVPVISVFYLATSDQLDCMYRLLATEINCIKTCKEAYSFDDSYYDRFENVKFFDKLSTVYIIIVEKSKLCKHTFGMQVRNKTKCCICCIYNIDFA